MRRGVTTDAAHAWSIYPNRAGEVCLTGPDPLWVADLTSIRLPTTFVSLAAIRDAWSRRCIGWRLGRTRETTLPLTALEHARAGRQPPPGLIHHSDRGVPYAIAAYTARLAQAGAQISMSAAGNPYTNAQAERFFKTRKCEEVDLQHDQTFPEAEANLGRFIDDVYHAKRLHSSLGYRPPIAFAAISAGHAAAAKS